MGEADRSVNLISPANLLGELAHGATEVVVLDVRQAPLDSKSGDSADPQAFLDGHIPNAIFVDIDAHLARLSTGTNGRRPLPAAEDFEKTVRHWGIDVTTPVVVYGATFSPAPARAWRLLRWAGLRSVRLLDGGVDGWVAQGGELQSGAAEDARPKSGHIPGAQSAPVAESFDAVGYLLPDRKLRERFRRLGVGPTSEPAAYCGTGVAAALEVFVLALLGIRARLYVGSASEWTADPSRVLAR